MTIGQHMTAARKAMGLSRYKFAAMSGVHVNVIRGYESDRNVPGLFNLIQLADTLGLSLDEYIGHEVKTDLMNLSRTFQSLSRKMEVSEDERSGR